jgi:hypothetical protein
VGRDHFDDTESVHGVEPDRFTFVGDLGPVPLFAFGPIDDLVVNIGDVGHQPDLETAPFEIPPQHVVDEGRSPMTEMRRTVDSGSAQVDPDLAGLA